MGTAGWNLFYVCFQMMHSKALGSFPQIDYGSPPPCRPRCVNKEVQVGKKRDGGAEKGHPTDHYAGWEDLPHQNIVEISQVSLNSF